MLNRRKCGGGADEFPTSTFPADQKLSPSMAAAGVQNTQDTEQDVEAGSVKGLLEAGEGGPPLRDKQSMGP